MTQPMLSCEIADPLFPMENLCSPLTSSRCFNDTVWEHEETVDKPLSMLLDFLTNIHPEEGPSSKTKSRRSRTVLDQTRGIYEARIMLSSCHRCGVEGGRRGGGGFLGCMVVTWGWAHHSCGRQKPDSTIMNRWMDG